MKRFLLPLLLAAALAGCSSGVKLDDVPVEDKTGTAVSALPQAGTGQAGTTGGAAQSAVAPVDLARPSDAAASPSNLGRIVYFDYDSYAIKPEFQQLIEAHARFIKGSASRRVVVEGHTDERGGREYNLALGQRRSEAIRRALGLLGVGDNQIEAVSFGKEKPAEPASTEAAYAKNRRAEIAYRP